MSIRELVRAHAAAAGLTPNAVATLVAGRVSRSQVFDFFNGSHDLTTEKADALLAALAVPMPDVPEPLTRHPRKRPSAGTSAPGR